MAKKFQGQRQWIRDVLNQLEGVGEPIAEEQQAIASEWPPWVSNLLLLLLGVSPPRFEGGQHREVDCQGSRSILGAPVCLHGDDVGRSVPEPCSLEGSGEELSCVGGLGCETESQVEPG